MLDLRGLSNITDYFVICSGTSAPHLKAIRRDISDKVQIELGEKPRNTDGDPENQWLVLDYINVIVHIFQKDIREHYALERLWGDAGHVRLPEERAVKAAKPARTTARPARTRKRV